MENELKNIDGNIQKQFGDVAQNYTTSLVHRQGEDLDTLIQIVNEHIGDVDKETLQVLDAGCGAGHTGLALAKQGIPIIAYDITEAMLAQVRKNATEMGLDNVTVEQGSVASLPFSDQAFDVIVSRYSAHHWQDVEDALEEFKRVLKPKGLLVISDIVAPRHHTGDTFLQTIEMLRDPSHVRDHSLQQWQVMLLVAGFATEIVYEFDLPLQFRRWLKRMNTPDAYEQAIYNLMRQAPEEMKMLFRLPNDMPVSDGEYDFKFIIKGAVMRAHRL